jgi:ornithine--oxo-acid transaminase
MLSITKFALKISSGVQKGSPRLQMSRAASTITQSTGSFTYTESHTTKQYLALEDEKLAHNYHPIPVVLSRGKNCYVWDVDDKKYLDFLSAYSAVNQGHCHPRIIAALHEQASKITLTARAFHNDQLPVFADYLTKLLGYDKMLPMNTGVEASETSIKLARRWAYDVKGVPKNQAKVVLAKKNFWGRSIAAISSSSDPESYNGYGPYVPGFELIDYNDLAALEKAIADPNCAAFMIEAVQGEAGVIVPDSNYLPEARRLCTKYNVLMILDEVQTGLGRTGKLLAAHHYGIKPDIVCLGKALSGGVMPASCVLANDDIMLVIKPGQHGSTYGGNPLASRVCLEAVKVIVEENMSENAEKQGKRFRDEIKRMKIPLFKEVRGQGLLNAIVIDGNADKAWEFCLKLAHLGLICKPTHSNIVRLAPPLTINDKEMDEAFHIIENAGQM